MGCSEQKVTGAREFQVTAVSHWQQAVVGALVLRQAGSCFIFTNVTIFGNEMISNAIFSSPGL